MHDEQVTQNTKPYSNTEIILQFLNDKNLSMAVATNKRTAPTKKLIDYLGWDKFFYLIECSDSKKKLRNKDQMVKDIIKNNCDFKKSYFVGDTVNDGLCANHNQLKFIRANYGFGGNENWDHINIFMEIENIMEIKKLI